MPPLRPAGSATGDAGGGTEAGGTETGGAGPGGASGRGARTATAFGRVLRQAGLDVPVGSVVAYAEALGAVGLGERDPVYWAGRATLTRGPKDVALYDLAFTRFWLQQVSPLALVHAPRERVLLGFDDDDDVGDGDPGADEGDRTDPVTAVRYSATEVLRHKDFARCTTAELAETHRLMADLRLAGAPRRSRRRRPSRPAQGTLDLRRTVRSALRTGGEAVRRPTRARATKPRRVVLLLDVSGSMDAYARALLRFGQAAAAGQPGRFEVFAIGTRLTRVTRELAGRDPDVALRMASAAVTDWSGGTRLGEGLRTFNDRWGVPGLARGAVVVILSDGWDRGDPEVLGEQMGRLHRVAHKVVWVNPLKATPGFAPLARGMAAALPWVDDFVEGHSLASLETLTKVVSA